MSKVKDIFTYSPIKEMSKGKSLTPLLAKNPVVAMPDDLEVKKKKMRESSRARAAFSGSLNTDLTGSNKLG